MAGASTARESALRHRGGRHRRTASPRHASWPEHFSLLARGTLDGFLSAYYDPPLRLGSFIETLAAKGKRATPRNNRQGATYGLLAGQIRTVQVFLGTVAQRWPDVLGRRQELSGKEQFTGNEERRYGVVLHSNAGLAVVGIARVVREAYPDPTTDDPRWVAVDVEPVETLKKPVSLSDIKKEKCLQN